MSKGGGSAPPSIDYTALGNAQTDSNLKTAAQQAGLNNVNTISPFSSATYTPYGTGQNGIGPAGYNLTETLNQPQADLLAGQTQLLNNITPTANDITNTIGSTKGIGGWALNDAWNNYGSALPKGGLDFTGLADLPTSKTDFSNEVNDASDAAYRGYTRYLDPKYDEKRSDLSQTLADQGISLGSDAYDRAQGDLGRQESFDYGQAADQATTAGQTEQNRLFGQNLSSRQQGVAEKEAQYTYPINALGSVSGTGLNILGGQASDLGSLGNLGNFSWAGNIPQTTGNTVVAPSNVVGAGNTQNQSYQNQFNANAYNNASMWGGLGSLGSTLGLTGSGGLLSGVGSSLGSALGIGGFNPLTGAGAVGPFLDASGGTGIATEIAPFLAVA